MRTFLRLSFSPEGTKPSELTDQLADLGFVPSHGAHDFVFDWPGDASIDEILHFGDRIHHALQGSKCFFELETL